MNISGGLPLFATGATSAAVQVTFTAPTTPQTNTIRAFYSGDSETKPSASASFVQAVQARAAGAAPLTTAVPVTVAPAPVAPPSSATPATATATVAASALRTLSAPLLRALARRGLAALADTRAAFTAAVPGTLTQRLYTPREPGAGRKPTLLAASTHRFRVPGSARLKLQLTAAGRRASRTRNSPPVTLVTRFAPTTGTNVEIVERTRARHAPATTTAASTLDRSWRRAAVRGVGAPQQAASRRTARR